jgi:hypothetical protein
MYTYKKYNKDDRENIYEAGLVNDHGDIIYADNMDGDVRYSIIEYDEKDRMVFNESGYLKVSDSLKHMMLPESLEPEIRTYEYTDFDGYCIIRINDPWGEYTKYVDNKTGHTIYEEIPNNTCHYTYYTEGNITKCFKHEKLDDVIDISRCDPDEIVEYHADGGHTLYLLDLFTGVYRQTKFDMNGFVIFENDLMIEAVTEYTKCHIAQDLGNVGGELDLTFTATRYMSPQINLKAKQLIERFRCI